MRQQRNDRPRADAAAVVAGAGVAIVLLTIGLGGANRPADAVTLQAVSAIGQSRLMRVYDDEFAGHRLVAGQVLLVPDDLNKRSTYLQARATLDRLVELGVVPIVTTRLVHDAVQNGRPVLQVLHSLLQCHQVNRFRH